MSRANSAKLFCSAKDCNASFLLQRGLTNHIKKVHGESSSQSSTDDDDASIELQQLRNEKIRKFTCAEENCKSSFSSKQYLSRHISSAHKPPAKCPVSNCNALIRPNSLFFHMKSMHLDAQQLCNNCKKPVGFSNLKRHIISCTSDGIKKFVCSVKDCKASFTTEKYLRAHVSVVHATPIECPFEDCKVFVKPACLKSHIKSIHEKLQHLCSNCGRKISHTNLTKHFDRCTSGSGRNEERKFFCSMEDCEASFATKAYLGVHLRTVHSTMQRCPYVDCKALLKPFSLDAHVKTVHEKLKRLCMNCEQQIPWKKLRSHLESCISKGENKFYCTIGDCESSFGSREALNSHNYRVHRSRVKCPYKNCISYMKPCSLNIHIRRVHDKVKKSCPNCGKLMSLGNLKPHLESCAIEGVKKFACSFTNCPSSFATKDNLRKHIIKGHLEKVDV